MADRFGGAQAGRGRGARHGGAARRCAQAHARRDRAVPDAARFRATITHDPEKRAAVFGQGHAQMKAPGFWGQKPGAAAALLSPAAAVYGAVAAKRLAMRGERVAVPVICVGNLTVGGSGKTPTAISIARLLMDAREKPMFLTRGYGGSLGGPVGVETQHPAAEVGAEPLLLARVAPTIVSRARPAGARLAQKKGATVVVMDDGV